MRIARFALACLSLFACTAAQAQTCPHKAVHVQHRAWIPVHRPQRGSTVAESYARGRADMVRAWGQHNLLDSRARINHAVADRQETENEVIRTQAYFHKREINRSYRFGERENSSTGTTIAAHTEPVDPDALLTTLLHDGRIAWPVALTRSTFAGHRVTAEQILYARVATGFASASDRAALAENSREMTCLLREHVQECTPQEFVDAKVFLKALCQFAEA